MKAIETSATFNENGEMIIDNPPKMKNKRVKLLFLYEDDSEDDFYKLASESLSKAYSDDEPEYNASMIKEPNPLYKDARR